MLRFLEVEHLEHELADAGDGNPGHEPDDNRRDAARDGALSDGTR
jgi:hypothetical protein